MKRTTLNYIVDLTAFIDLLVIKIWGHRQSCSAQYLLSKKFNIVRETSRKKFYTFSPQKARRQK